MIECLKEKIIEEITTLRSLGCTLWEEGKFEGLINACTMLDLLPSHVARVQERYPDSSINWCAHFAKAEGLASWQGEPFTEGEMKAMATYREANYIDQDALERSINTRILKYNHKLLMEGLDQQLRVVEINSYKLHTTLSSPPGTSEAIITQWVVKVSAYLKKEGLEWWEAKIDPEGLGALVGAITSKKITSKEAKEVFDIMWEGIVDFPTAHKQLPDRNIDMSLVGEHTTKVITDNVDIAAKWKVEAKAKKKKKLLNYLVGEVAKLYDGNADMKIVKEHMINALGGGKE